ncbi:efflux RND transporter periplasmic adaptor subunit [Serratia ureilytica]|uniref:efflux RND transporter periplasmic adaptor subunit n=1 Tax=Serratia ureilytica TaxID=300181 RepID=UPI00313F384A
MYRLKRKFSFLLFLSLTMLANGCEDTLKGKTDTGETPVKTIIVKEQPFEITTELPGRIKPLRVAEVGARVTGIVLKRHFEEGANVKAGELLFDIDPTRFLAEIAKSKAEVSRTEANYYEAQATLNRYKKLVESSAISKQDLDKAEAAYKRTKAEYDSAIASLEIANINLDYTKVKAPISGRIGKALVTEGALVSGSDNTTMATIQQVDTVYADFQQSVLQLLSLRKAFSAGTLDRDTAKRIPVFIELENIHEVREGYLLFSDITVDKGTEQVSLRGIFPNKDNTLLPGMFVRVRLGQGVDPKAILIPQRAVHLDLVGNASVYIVNNSGRIERRNITTGKVYGSDWHILDGLIDGEQVIVSGNVSEGKKTKPELFADKS